MIKCLMFLSVKNTARSGAEKISPEYSNNRILLKKKIGRFSYE